MVLQRSNRIRFVIQRSHSHWVAKDIPSFGYEFSHFIKLDIDATISERSLSAGTKLFYGSSTQCKSQFERLSELSFIDEIDLTPMMIGCSVPSQSLSHPQEAVQSIAAAMHDRPLDFVTASFDEQASPPAAATATALSLIKQQNPLSAVGIELRTSLLANTASSAALIDMCQSLRAQKLLDVLVLAANPYTNYIVKPLLSWATAQGVVTIAHDIFRGHPQSPGLFLPPSVSRQRRAPTVVPAMEEAIEQFKKSLDSCVRMEKIFVEKLPSRNPQVLEPLKPIFLGFTLANSQHQILFLEEWDHIRDQQIAPKFDKAIKDFEKLSAEASDFSRLYVPLRRNLIRAFEAVLYARQEMLTAEAHQSGSEACDPSPVRNALCNSLFHEAVVKSWRLSGFDFVLCTGTEVFAENWSRDVTAMSPQGQEQKELEQIAGRYLGGALKTIRDHI